VQLSLTSSAIYILYVLCTALVLNRYCVCVLYYMYCSLLSPLPYRPTPVPGMHVICAVFPLRTGRTTGDTATGPGRSPIPQKQPAALPPCPYILPSLFLFQCVVGPPQAPGFPLTPCPRPKNQFHSPHIHLRCCFPRFYHLAPEGAGVSIFSVMVCAVCM
jgi:hypothetical protein